MYDLDIESGEPGEGEVGGEIRQTMPALLYDAHGGRFMDPSFTWFPILIVAPLTPAISISGLPHRYRRGCRVPSA